MFLGFALLRPVSHILRFSALPGLFCPEWRLTRGLLEESPWEVVLTVCTVTFQSSHS